MKRTLGISGIALLASLLSGCIVVIGDSDDRRDSSHRGYRSASPAEAEPDWTVLFDGSSLEAWRGFKADTVPAGWRIEDGALARVDGGGDIITKEQFDDFELVFEWKVTEGANSGVFFHVTEDMGATYQTGPEYQILDNVGHRDGGDPRTSAAANYALHAPPTDFTNPVGEWNIGRIVVEDGEVSHWLNGHKVVEYELWTDEWKAMVKESKFDSMPAYGTRKRGHIALQDHGDLVYYRNVMVRSL